MATKMPQLINLISNKSVRIYRGIVKHYYLKELYNSILMKDGTFSRYPLTLYETVKASVLLTGKNLTTMTNMIVSLAHLLFLFY
jgi:hypothetical protein